MKVGIVATSAEEYRQARKFAGAIVEVRADCEPALVGKDSDVILTLRSKKEGGRFEGSPTERAGVLDSFIEVNPSHIDLEIRRDLHLLGRILSETRSTVILSVHDYEARMVDLVRDTITELRHLLANERIILKIVGNSKSTWEAIEAQRHAVPYRCIVLSIARNGDVLRTCGRALGQYLVYGSLRKDFLVPAEPLLARKPLLIGLLGKTLHHSLSPQIHSLFMRYSGEIGHYHLLEAADDVEAEKLMGWVKQNNFSGINITFPYKGIAKSACEELDRAAELSEAVNTVLLGSKVVGHNTDVTGFLKAYTLKGTTALVLGGGGAARAVCVALIQREFTVTVALRTEQRKNEFPHQIRKRLSFVSAEELSTAGYDIFVNCTPVGLNGEDLSQLVRIENGTKLILDLTYSKDGTPLTRKWIGRSSDGKAMLFHQAADAYEIWTNKILRRDELMDQFQEVVHES